MVASKPSQSSHKHKSIKGKPLRIRSTKTRRQHRRKKRREAKMKMTKRKERKKEKMKNTMMRWTMATSLMMKKKSHIEKNLLRRDGESARKKRGSLLSQHLRFCQNVSLEAGAWMHSSAKQWKKMTRSGIKDFLLNNKKAPKMMISSQLKRAHLKVETHLTQIS